METKQCTKCNQIKQLTEYYKRKQSSDGLAPKCKACDKAYKAKTSKRTKELKTEWSSANKERVSNYNKAYSIENKDDIRANRIIYNENNAEKIAASLAQWKIDNTDKIYQYNAKRRALQLDSSVSNNKEETYLIECVYAFSRFKSRTTGIMHHVDHKKPLARGGEHRLYNLQILTAFENQSKGAKLL